MKSSVFKLSVGIVGFLGHETRGDTEGAYSAPPASVGFLENPQKPDSEPDIKPDNSDDDPASNRAVRTRSVTPSSRHPLIPPEVRAKIEAIEADARAKGWPAELLWNSEFWGSPRGLAAVLDEEDVIAEVAADYIAILKMQRNILRFQRRVS
jgi:hypothetical protein